MLDARHKLLSFLTTSERLIANAKLHEMASAVVLTESQTEKPNSRVTQSVQQTQAGGDDRKRALTMSNYNERDIKDSESEVNNSPPSLDRSPLDWWKANATRFPRLSQLAKSDLCIPVTSVPSERVFSAAGLTVNRLRTRLTLEHVNMLIFLNKNQ